MNAASNNPRHPEPCRRHLISRDQDGYCSHLDRDSLASAIREHGSVPCRAYACCRDGRIRLDYETRTPNPDITDAGWHRCLIPQNNQGDRA